MNPPVAVRWDLVARACSWYNRWGYRYVEVPWIVTKRAVEITLPPGRFGYYLGHPNYSPGHLVGSAEQGFLQMVLDGRLEPGRYCAAGPCFRDEEVLDELHHNCFFKVELIEVVGPSRILDDDSVYGLMATAKRFFEEESHQETKVVPTPDVGPSAYDLELNGIEIGSYGMRAHENIRWIYGTGLALPRFNIAAEDSPEWNPW